MAQEFIVLIIILTVVGIPCLWFGISNGTRRRKEEDRRKWIHSAQLAIKMPQLQRGAPPTQTQPTAPLPIHFQSPQKETIQGAPL
ncbi:hypothetical protein PM082_014947 [Marasmius tenuissimus]|nr:hypothetical protein PM082_014947 [Marasmius tenuissimus]